MCQMLSITQLQVSSLPSGLTYKTNLILSSISFTDQGILKILKSLNVSEDLG